MGLGLGFLRDLIELKTSGALDGAHRLAEIGAQQLSDTLIESEELLEAYRLFDCATPLLLNPVGAENFTQLAPPAAPFWEALGFSHTAFDIDGAAIRLDLNRDRVPETLSGRFDLVINAGTTEHIANQENAFRAIHDLTASGGVMYHEVPAGGLIDHGFFGYQPKFFHRLSQQNDYGVVLFKMNASGFSAVPDYIHAYNRQFGGSMLEQVPDFTLRVAFRKRHKAPFSCPIDAAPHLIPLPPRPPWRRLRRRLGQIKRAVSRRLPA